MKKYLVLALVALMFAAAGPAMAQSEAPSAQPIPDTWVGISQALGSVVYDNGTTDPTTDTGNEMSQWVQADDFELDADGTLTGAEVDWFDLNSGFEWDGGIMWYIFADAGGTPGPVLDSGNGIEVLTTLISNAYGWDWFITEFDFDHTTVTLTANTRYWFGLHWAGDLDYVRDDVYFAHTAEQNFNPSQESEFGLFNNWDGPGLDRGFRLLGDGGDGEPPVPAIGPTGMILLIGLLMLGSAFYFRRMRQTS